jgi:hypothetical protein
VYSRYLLGGAFVFASIEKMLGKRFTTYDMSNTPIHSPMHLFETLYQSGMYWQFLGLCQCITGLVLMTQKYGLLGALLFLPIMMNITAITITYDFGGTSYITVAMFIPNILLVVWDYERLLPLVGLPLQNDVHTLHNHNTITAMPLWRYTGLLLLFCITVAVVWLWGRNIFLWFILCSIVGLVSLVRGIRTSQQRH